MEWPGSLDEYQKLVSRMNTPRVVIDNAVCATATVVKVDSARKRGVLLEAVQALSDLDLSINKAYISSDGRWFMDVFHVTDRLGRKLADDRILSLIERSLTDEAPPAADDAALTALELTGTDRPGLLSEVFAVLADLQCSVVEAKVWTHNGRIASLIFIRDDDGSDPEASIAKSPKINLIERRLKNVLKGDDDVRESTTAVSSTAIAHADRRLHQLMVADRDSDRSPSSSSSSSSSSSTSCTSSCPSPAVSVQNWIERGYSVVTVQCRDRSKLLFDVVCALTDMEYIVFHGTIDTDGDRAHQEFYIRHSDGSPISSEAEKQRVIQCIEAAIERRPSEGLRLELCTVDRRSLLSDVTRALRENGLSITLAEVSTKGEMASNVFYVTDAAGHPADAKAIDAVRQRIGISCLKISEEMRRQPATWARPAESGGSVGSVGIGLFYLGSLVKRNLFNLGLIKSCS